ncbi:hypothetical protein WA026_005360 [Henosepilachna vigintioctopunctata]|uniref:Uncharacterized protein n=1 Tax=Henosepilachna vigintioctopunctata TaxID=420089 RepID=A0AAW1U3J3_9CUCU
MGISSISACRAGRAFNSLPHNIYDDGWVEKRRGFLVVWELFLSPTSTVLWAEFMPGAYKSDFSSQSGSVSVEKKKRCLARDWCPNRLGKETRKLNSSTVASDPERAVTGALTRKENLKTQAYGYVPALPRKNAERRVTLRRWYNQHRVEGDSLRSEARKWALSEARNKERARERNKYKDTCEGRTTLKCEVDDENRGKYPKESLFRIRWGENGNGLQELAEQNEETVKVVLVNKKDSAWRKSIQKLFKDRHPMMKEAGIERWKS